MVKRNMRLSYLTLAIVVLCCVTILCKAQQDDEPSFTKNPVCFNNINSQNTCERNRIAVKSVFYLCHDILKLNSPPQAIRVEDNKIYATEGRKSYVVHKLSKQFQEVKRLVHSVDEYEDKYGNRYYTVDNKLFFSRRNETTDQEFHIKGKSDKIIQKVTQIALDYEAEILFVMSMDPAQKQPIAKLFALSTSAFGFETEAVLINEISEVSSIAMDEESRMLLVGVLYEDRGRILRLKRRDIDPCAIPERTAAVLEVFKEAESRILSLLEIESPNAQAPSYAALQREIDHLRSENEKLNNTNEYLLQRNKDLKIEIELLRLQSEETATTVKVRTIRPFMKIDRSTIELTEPIK